MGKRKIELKKVENRKALQVTFSKRRQGLFKKASELSTLCGVEVFVLVFSPAGRPYHFCHPDADPNALLQRFISHHHGNTEARTEGGPRSVERIVADECTSLEELESLKKGLEDLKAMVLRRAEELSMPQETKSSKDDDKVVVTEEEKSQESVAGGGGGGDDNIYEELTPLNFGAYLNTWF